MASAIESVSPRARASATIFAGLRAELGRAALLGPGRRLALVETGRRELHAARGDQLLDGGETFVGGAERDEVILLGRQHLLGLERAVDHRLDFRVARGLLDGGELRGSGGEIGDGLLVHALRDRALQLVVERGETGGLVGVLAQAERGRNRLHRVLLVGLCGGERGLIAERWRIDERHSAQARRATIGVVPERGRGVAVLLLGDQLRAFRRPFDAAEQRGALDLERLDPAHRVGALALRRLHVGRVADVDGQIDGVRGEGRRQRRAVDGETAAVAAGDVAELRKDRDPLRRRLVGAGRGQRGEDGAGGERRGCRSGLHGLTMPGRAVPDCR